MIGINGLNATEALIVDLIQNFDISYDSLKSLLLIDEIHVEATSNRIYYGKLYCRRSEIQRRSLFDSMALLAAMDLLRFCSGVGSGGPKISSPISAETRSNSAMSVFLPYSAFPLLQLTEQGTGRSKYQSTRLITNCGNDVSVPTGIKSFHLC